MAIVQFLAIALLLVIALVGGLAIIGGLFTSLAVIAFIALCFILIACFAKINWKPLLSGYYMFILRAGSFVGKPGIAMDVWMLQRGNTCAINVQRMVLAICGIHKSESELAMRNEGYGLYSKNLGSSDISNLIEGYGLPVWDFPANNKKEFYKSLYYTLREGRLAVASVNSNLLNNPDQDFRSSHKARANHAILLTGLRNIGDGKFLVYYTDSGIADGALKCVDSNVMHEALGNKIVMTTLVFDGGKRLWPYTSTGLDEIPLNSTDSTDGSSTIAPCPQCDKRLKFRLTTETRVKCPRCKYRFKAIKKLGLSKKTADEKETSTDSDHDKQAKADVHNQQSGDTSSPRGEYGSTFVNLKSTCKSCQHTFTDTFARGPSVVPLRCPSCGHWDEYRTR